ncbi:hypothetical protein Z951_44150 [Streptomyces sp. PRh5]|uniref:hypothetical protein n=1 Tax=Streptomyces sp. PRh5 TaxID=1158056 RepID=UPI00044F7F4A|nr:hypothetical protein [Streptomyces sp. PRh5]EXU61990.1 hypothetical protein Z951_44150 [Streptomyces sp. PRh5]
MRRAGTALLAATACLAALPCARAWAGTPGPAESPAAAGKRLIRSFTVNVREPEGEPTGPTEPIGELRVQHLVPAGVLR